jgi:hypothetical protein
MLDHPINQAAGLLAMAPEPRTRLIALVSHGDAAAELPLLLRMCSALVGLGFPVTVLDGTVRESQDNPGLEQMLSYSAPPAASTDGASWSVVPALYGLQMLSSGLGANSDPLQECGWLFPHDSVAIVYAPAGVLVQLLGGTSVRPVLAVSTGKSSLLTGYLALKRLVLKGKLSPMVVNFVENALPGDRSLTTASVGVGLQDYAKYFLNYDVSLFSVSPTKPSEFVDRAVERLALGLLESAIQLTHRWAPASHCAAPAFQPSTMLGIH